MRAVLAVLLLLFAIPASAADAPWTGHWDTRWRDGGARMDLVQDGSRVSGTYPSLGGRIEGIVSGRQLQGRWIEANHSGALTFVLAPDGNSFMGRFDTGEWWTGQRIEPGADGVTIDRSGPRQALRTFVTAGNAAAEDPDEWAKAAAVLDFGAAGAAMMPGQKLAAARTLFDLVNQTTFQLWTVPGASDASQLNINLVQAGTGVVLPLVFARDPDAGWRIRSPEGDLGALRTALLARSGGHFASPDDYTRRATPRDALRNFLSGFRDGSEIDHDAVLATMDLSGFSEATRAYEGDLAATYLDEALHRVGQIVPQEIPDDPKSRLPYTLFSHPAGSIVLVPTNPAGSPEGGSWRFSEQTVDTARDLYTAIEDMPEVDSSVPDRPSAYMQLRRWVRGVAPALLTPIGPLESWQIVGTLAVLGGSFAAAAILTFVLLAALRRILGGEQAPSERGLVWPLRMTLTLLLYRVLGALLLGLPEVAKRVSFGAGGVVLALAVVWGGWRLIDTFGERAMRRAQATAGTLDEIVVSLASGALKLVLFAGGLLSIAQALSLPYQGVLAGLGIGGLAIAFASKETLSNLFGAGILVVDRPFRRGDWIEAGGTKGVVEHVGIRSTRIRSGDDSLIFVPNGKLADATVNNLGTRRHRVFKLVLLVSAGTAADRLVAFMDRLKTLLLDSPHVLPETAGASLGGLTPAGVEIDLGCCLDRHADEKAIRTDLLLDILRLAEEMDIALDDRASGAAPELKQAA